MKTDDQKAAELKRLAAMPDDEIDQSDIPERSDWAGAEIGKFYRPVQSAWRQISKRHQRRPPPTRQSRTGRQALV
jgi:hypothetical protein